MSRREVQVFSFFLYAILTLIFKDQVFGRTRAKAAAALETHFCKACCTPRGKPHSNAFSQLVLLVENW